MDQRQRNVAMELAHGLTTKRDIAKKYQITEQTLYNWLSKEDFKKILNEISCTLQQEKKEIMKNMISELYFKSLFVINDLLCSPDEKVRLTAAIKLFENFKDNYKDNKQSGIKKIENDLLQQLEQGEERT